MKAQLNFVVALQSEAQPLINHFKMVKQDCAGVNYFATQSDDYDINLIVAGIGQIATACAVGWLAERCQAYQCAWLNIGTAGHASIAVGNAVLVAHSHSSTQQRGYYASNVVSWSGEIASLLTADQVVNDYTSPYLLDMEGYAFFQTASRFTPAELVQAIKVVSDNNEADIAALDGAKLTSLIEQRVNEIAAFAELLIQLAKELPNKRHITTLCKQNVSHLHVTASQQRQVADLVEKLVATGVQQTDLFSELQQASQIKSLLSGWRQRLDSEPPAL